jgi:hypothetical protein
VASASDSPRGQQGTHGSGDRREVRREEIEEPLRRRRGEGELPVGDAEPTWAQVGLHHAYRQCDSV